MAKVDHLQQLKGRTLLGPERISPNRRRGRESFSRKIELTKAQAQAVENCIEHELALYNALVEHLHSRLKATPEFFIQLTDEQARLFSILVGIGYSIANLADKKSEETALPKKLEPYRHILFGLQGDKEIGLSDKLQVFYEICSFYANVFPDTREGIAYELMEFCLRQAKVMKQYTHEGEYRAAPETLEIVNNLQKRHIQIRRDFIKVEWSEKDDMTKMWIPHLKSPILVHSDLTEAPDHWNMVIIHKDPNRLPLGKDINWEIDFKKVRSRYLIKYLECKNPISQMESRFIGLRM